MLSVISWNTFLGTFSQAAWCQKRHMSHSSASVLSSTIWLQEPHLVTGFVAASSTLLVLFFLPAVVRPAIFIIEKKKIIKIKKIKIWSDKNIV